MDYITTFLSAGLPVWFAPARDTDRDADPAGRHQDLRSLN
jgi:hypothetical protein